MTLYELTPDSIMPLNSTTFAAKRIKEREDLQRVLRDRIDIAAVDVMVLAEEFQDWSDSQRRIDLLGLDRDANLVVFELKRMNDGSHMELQAIRYAAMVSTMTFEQAVAAHEHYLSSRGHDRAARDTILAFLGWDEPDDESFGADVRIVLVSANFSSEITTSALWLNQRGLDIRCVRLAPYELDGRILIDSQQVLPLPEASEYQVRIRNKEQRKRSSRWNPKSMEEIWREFETRRPVEEVAAAREIRDWLDDRFDEVFPTADSFAPLLADKSRNQFFLKVHYDGWVQIWFTHLASNEPFASEELREVLRQKLNEIPGVDITPDRIKGKPKFALELMVDPTNRRRFFTILEWVLERVASDENAGPKP